MMTGLNVSVGGGSGDDALSLSVSGSPKDLEEGFKLAYLLMTEGKIEESALKLWKEQMAQGLEHRKTSVEAQLMEKISGLLTNDDPRTRTLTTEQLNAIGLDSAQKLLEQVLKNG